MNSEKKYALITGGTSGIGLELAKVFAKNGYSLIIAARSKSELAETADAIKSEYLVEVVELATDLFQIKNAYSLYNSVKLKGIEIDVLVNNAGQGQYGEFIDNDIQRELDIIQLNISSLVTITKYFLKDMVKRGNGKILNVASIAGKMPGPLQAVYHATKAFVHSFTIALRDEVKDKGVVITSLLPGATDTDFFKKASMQTSKIVQEGKLANPADVAKDGFNALMAGDDMVVSGMQNKIQVAIGNVTSDSKVAEKVHKQQAPVDKKNDSL